MSRKKLDIDPKKVETLARHGMTNLEIAEVFDCDNSTIGKRFSKILTKGRADRKHSLRRRQWKAAMQGNIPMLIWLGKNELDQSDKLETKHSGDPEKPVIVKVLKGVSLDDLR